MDPHWRTLERKSFVRVYRAPYSSGHLRIRYYNGLQTLCGGMDLVTLVRVMAKSDR